MTLNRTLAYTQIIRNHFLFCLTALAGSGEKPRLLGAVASVNIRDRRPGWMAPNI